MRTARGEGTGAESTGSRRGEDRAPSGAARAGRSDLRGLGTVGEASGEAPVCGTAGDPCGAGDATGAEGSLGAGAGGGNVDDGAS